MSTPQRQRSTRFSQTSTGLSRRSTGLTKESTRLPEMITEPRSAPFRIDLSLKTARHDPGVPKIRPYIEPLTKGSKGRTLYISLGSPALPPNGIARPQSISGNDQSAHMHRLQLRTRQHPALRSSVPFSEHKWLKPPGSSSARRHLSHPCNPRNPWLKFFSENHEPRVSLRPQLHPALRSSKPKEELAEGPATSAHRHLCALAKGLPPQRPTHPAFSKCPNF